MKKALPLAVKAFKNAFQDKLDRDSAIFPTRHLK